MARGLIAVPGIVGPIAPGARLVRSDAADLGVQERERVIQAVHAVLADHAEKPHAAAHLDRARARAAHLFDHFRLVALGEQQFFPRFAAVARADGDQRFGDVVEGVLPGNLHKLVLAAGIEHIFRFVLRRELGKARVGPGFPALAHDRMAQPIGSVDHAVEGIALGALARIPVGRRFVAVEVGIVLVVVSAAETRDDAVAHVGAHAAGVGVVGRANPVEAPVVLVLIAVNFLPVSIDRAGKRILLGADRGEQVERQAAAKRRAAADAKPLQELAAG